MRFRALAAAMIAVLSSGCGQSRPTEMGAAPSPTPTQSQGPEGPEKSEAKYVGFYPESRMENGYAVMPLVFVDGSSATAVAPSHLGIQDMSAVINTSGGLGGVDRTMAFRYRNGSSLMGEGPLESYEGVDGTTVEVWEPIDHPAGCPFLVFRFGGWFAGVRTCQDELTESQKREWARLLSGDVTDGGFLVLSAHAPLRLQETGGHEGPEMIIGMGRANWIELEPGRCDPQTVANDGDIRTMSDGTRVSFNQIGGGNNSYDYDWSASWCEDGLMRVQVEYAYENFAKAAAEGFRLRDVVLAD